MRYFFLFSVFVIPLTWSMLVAQSDVLTAGEVVQRIKSNVTCEWLEETVDNFKAGDESSVVTGVATTFLANLDVLMRAKEQGINMVITHEPTFYNHFDKKHRYGDDPVLNAKLKFIRENDMVVWRFHDHWHLTQPDGIYKGFIERLDWTGYSKDKSRYVIPETSLGDLASHLKNVFNANAIRVIGDPAQKITNVAVSLGAPGSMVQIELLRTDDVDVLVGGESPEWETVEYVRDAISAGMNKSLIFLGHAISEEDGMEYCAEWLKPLIPEIPVEFVPAKEPFWIPD